MTIGQLARRTGMPVKKIRGYADRGLIYTHGRSPAGYRLFGEEALWCVQVIDGLRALGLTVAEIRALGRAGATAGPVLARSLRLAKERTTTQIALLQRRLGRIEAFERERAAELAGRVPLRTGDPRA